MLRVQACALRDVVVAIANGPDIPRDEIGASAPSHGRSTPRLTRDCTLDVDRDRDCAASTSSSAGPFYMAVVKSKTRGETGTHTHICWTGNDCRHGVVGDAPAASTVRT